MAQGKIEPFKIAVNDDILADLYARIERTRFPDEITDAGWDYGTNLAYLQGMIKYWRAGYDWRKHERELNRFDHFKTSIDGLDIHFIHQPGRGPNPIPLLLIHGWPGSIYEFNQIIPMLTDPMAQGAGTNDSFTVIAPSLPGYGFSGRPAKRGFGIAAMAATLHKLMTEVLGYKRYAVQGGDWGAVITSCIAYTCKSSLKGIHVNMLGVGPAEGRSAPALTEEEKKFLAVHAKFRHEETGYQAIQGTKPQTLAYGLNDSPAGLAAWIVEKFHTWSDCGNDIETCFTKDQLLTNIMIYWITGTINSSTRLYYEYRHNPWKLDQGTRIETPTGVAVFPRELSVPPRSWAERAYNIKRWTVMPRGGHFAAMEQPKMLADDIRAYFYGLD